MRARGLVDPRVWFGEGSLSSAELDVKTDLLNRVCCEDGPRWSVPRGRCEEGSR